MSAPAINPFVWADYFETGFDDVDGQHHKLVDFINALAGRAISGVPIRPDELSHSLDGLARYAVHHFATEEALMERAGLDPRHIGAHRKAHADFVTQVEAMRGTADPMGALPGLYNFVTSWLSFHILDTDQSMARQLRAVAAGASPAQAFVADQAQSRDPGSTALIAAVRSLLGLVAERNKELQKRVFAQFASRAGYHPGGRGCAIGAGCLRNRSGFFCGGGVLKNSCFLQPPQEIPLESFQARPVERYDIRLRRLFLFAGRPQLGTTDTTKFDKRIHGLLQGSTLLNPNRSGHRVRTAARVYGFLQIAHGKRIARSLSTDPFHPRGIDSVRCCSMPLLHRPPGLPPP